MIPNDESRIGRRFGRLTVIGQRRSKGRVLILCRCDCGKQKEVRESNAKSGNTLSCGCFKSDRIAETKTIHGAIVGTTRGGKPTREYTAWHNMKSGYKKRGTNVPERWHSFANYLADIMEQRA